MKEWISILSTQHQGILDTQEGMNPFAAGMSMFVSLLSAMTIIGLPVEGPGLKNLSRYGPYFMGIHVFSTSF